MGAPTPSSGVRPSGIVVEFGAVGQPHIRVEGVQHCSATKAREAYPNVSRRAKSTKGWFGSGREGSQVAADDRRRAAGVRKEVREVCAGSGRQDGLALASHGRHGRESRRQRNRNRLRRSFERLGYNYTGGGEQRQKFRPRARRSDHPPARMDVVLVDAPMHGERTWRDGDAKVETTESALVPSDGGAGVPS